MATNEVREILWRASDSVPRNGEGSIAQLADGRLLLAYTQFYGGSADDSEARIAGRFSEDGGLSWAPSFVLQPNVGRMNVMSASLLGLSSGKLAFLYLVKNSLSDLRAHMRISEDAETWSDPVCATPERGYHVVNNDRLVQLASGRILVPTCTHPQRVHGGNWATVFYSDDGGASWARSDSQMKVEASKSGMQEPGVVELKDGSLLMFMRCDLGFIYQSLSTDEGITWSDPQPTSLRSPVSPSTLKRIPGTGDLLAIWNNREGHPRSEPFSRRTPLTSAISRDEGETWESFRNIEDDRSRTYCYTSVAFAGRRALLTYYVSEHLPEGERVLASLKLKILGQDWFYGPPG
jgi:hypothetical protein